MLSFAYDEYVQGVHDGGNAIWIAELSNGETVYQDDGRFTPSSAWLRLIEYVTANNLRVNSLQLNFRGVESSKLIRQDDGQRFFYAKRLTAIMGVGSNTELGIGMTTIGNPNELNIIWHQSPSLEITDGTQRECGDDKWLI